MAGLTLFRDIAVVPVTRVHQHVACGGPIWPNFNRQTAVRHCRGKRPWDEKPVLVGQAEPLADAALWGGFLDSHFGHFVADHLPRLPLALCQRPEDRVLFTVDPGMTRDNLAPWVWQLCDWIGLAQDRVHLVTAPLRVAQMRVAAQGEMLPQVGPSLGHLALIERWAQALVPQMTPLLYVSRLGLPQKGGGAHAGEAYVVQRLQALGVAVLDPARAPIAAQMAAYAGAGRIVFAEGSAIHGRQLLGWVAQDISVLRRRADKVMAQASLRPRCRSLTYHDVGSLMLMAYWKNGTPRPDPALSLYDVPALWQCFQEVGVDLAAGWQADDYRASALADVADWLGCQKPDAAQMHEYRAALAQAGLAGHFEQRAGA